MESCLGCPIVNDPSRDMNRLSVRRRRTRWALTVFASVTILLCALFFFRDSLWNWWTGGRAEEGRFSPGALDDYVPEDSEAILVADLRSLLHSPRGSSRLRSMSRQLLGEDGDRPRWMELLGINVLEDVENIKISFAPGSGSAPLWLMRGRFDRSRAQIGPGKLREQRLEGCRAWEYADRTTKRTMLLALAGDTLIAGESHKRVMAALRQAQDPHPAAVRDATLRELLTKVDHRQTLWVTASIKSLGPIAGIDNYLLKMVLNPLLQNADSVYGGAKVAEDVRLELAFGTANEERAERLQTDLQSIRDAAPGATLFLGGQKELAPLLRLLGSSKISRENNMIYLQSRLSVFGDNGASGS
jgi:hypothetical protein